MDTSSQLRVRQRRTGGGEPPVVAADELAARVEEQWVDVGTGP
jgi:hypothetical protein